MTGFPSFQPINDSDVQSLRGLLWPAPTDILYDDDIGIPGNRTGILYRPNEVRLS